MSRPSATAAKNQKLEWKKLWQYVFSILSATLCYSGHVMHWPFKIKFLLKLELFREENCWKCIFVYIRLIRYKLFFFENISDFSLAGHMHNKRWKQRCSHQPNKMNIFREVLSSHWNNCWASRRVTSTEHKQTTAWHFWKSGWIIFNKHFLLLNTTEVPWNLKVSSMH